jgi:hypothetical protein
MKLLTPLRKPGVADKLGHVKYLLLIPTAVMMLSGVMSAQAATTPKIQVRSDSNFNNFDNLLLKVNVPAYPMIGEYRFIKISDTNGDVLFLGEVSPNEIFTLPVHKLKSAAKLTIEIFSDDGVDKRVVLVTQLVK